MATHAHDLSGVGMGTGVRVADVGDGSELSPEQRYALQCFENGENLFVSGPGGSGKSHLIRYFVKHLYTKGRIHQVTSTTGCSAILLSNQIRIAGRPIVVKTIHSWSGIRLGKGTLADIVMQVFKTRRAIKEWKRCRVLILDEISMLSNKLFTVLEYLGRYIRGNDKPFGGIQVVCLGDFFQLPPVGSTEEPDSTEFAFESPAWARVFPLENHVELVTVYRQTDDTYKRILNEVRRASISEESIRTLQTRVGLHYDPEMHNGVRPMKLFATRNLVNRVNTSQYGGLSGQEYLYEMTYNTYMTTYVDNGEPLEKEVLEQCRALTSQDIAAECKHMEAQVPVEERMALKVGVPVMCLVNVDVDAGIANGSMGVVVDFVPADKTVRDSMLVPLVQFYNGVSRPIAPYTWQSAEFPTIAVSQVPLSLAYASSIHKMQGATLDVAEMDLGGSIFAEHQTYVALSRVRSLEGIYLSSFHPEKIRVNPKVVQFYNTFASVEVVEESESESGSVVTSPNEDSPADTFPDVGVGCPICLEDQFDYPHDTECGHRFCHDCIVRLIQCNITRHAPCPICRQDVSLYSLKPVKTAKKKK